MTCAVLLNTGPLSCRKKKHLAHDKPEFSNESPVILLEGEEMVILEERRPFKDVVRAVPKGTEPSDGPWF